MYLIRTLSKCYFGSKILYAVLEWSQSSHPAKILQCKCIRLIAGLQYQHDCCQSFIYLKILTLPCIYSVRCLMYIKQNLNIFSAHSNIHNPPTRNNINLTKARNDTRYYGITFCNVFLHQVRTLNTQTFKFFKIKITCFLQVYF